MLPRTTPSPDVSERHPTEAASDLNAEGDARPCITSWGCPAVGAIEEIAGSPMQQLHAPSARRRPDVETYEGRDYKFSPSHGQHWIIALRRDRDVASNVDDRFAMRRRNAVHDAITFR
jgi:hypothetical protein